MSAMGGCIQQINVPVLLDMNWEARNCSKKRPAITETWMVEKKGFYFKVKIDNMEKESQFTSGEMGNFSVTVTWKV